MRDESKKAFPRPVGAISAEEFSSDQEGMTMREWFAGMALQGLLASCGEDPDLSTDPAAMAKDAFKFADAMLAQAKKGEG